MRVKIAGGSSMLTCDAAGPWREFMTFSSSPCAALAAGCSLGPHDSRAQCHSRRDHTICCVIVREQETLEDYGQLREGYFRMRSRRRRRRRYIDVH